MAVYNIYHALYESAYWEKVQPECLTYPSASVQGQDSYKESLDTKIVAKK